MKKYIDADLAKSELEDLDESGRLYYMGVFDVINSQPAADVAEVVHGEWVDYADSFWGRIGRMDLRCSLCGKRASSFVGGTEDWWDNYKPNYCPNCGAKMDIVLSINRAEENCKED